MDGKGARGSSGLCISPWRWPRPSVPISRGAHEVLKAAQASVLPMVVVGIATMRVGPELQEAIQVLRIRHGAERGAKECTMFCKAHGEGKRCKAVGCTSEGSTSLVLVKWYH
ncbi:hypothetical protein IFM89_038511 [Coptis chinensis]|uniref:Uncharacterized protein n=1 Tax=Coptis chinensis TaxID=261450 RepID=A0A835IIK3_9MAGN|nr:hypothetical protein IFM89_038511 [Coptis chinensis]